MKSTDYQQFFFRADMCLPISTLDRLVRERRGNCSYAEPPAGSALAMTTLVLHSCALLVAFWRSAEPSSPRDPRLWDACALYLKIYFNMYFLCASNLRIYFNMHTINNILQYKGSTRMKKCSCITRVYIYISYIYSKMSRYDRFEYPTRPTLHT